MGRIGHDVIERAGDARRQRGGQIADHDIDPPGQAVRPHVLAREPHQIGLQLDTDQVASPDAAGEAQRCRAHTRARLENPRTGFGRHRSRQKHRIDGGTVAVSGLAQQHRSIQQRILGDRIRQGCLRHPPP